MAGFTEKALSSLRGLPSLVPSIDVSGYNEAGLQAVLADTRAAQRCLDGLVMRIGVRSNQLAAKGAAAPSEGTLRGAGTIASRQARRESARAAAAEQIDGLGVAASNGETTGEHVDSIARHTAKLSEEQRSTFDFADLVEQAKHMLPEAFDRYVKRQVQATIADHGLGDTKAKQAASEFRHWFDEVSGMGRFAGSLDPERYEALTNAIDQRVASIAATSEETVVKNKNLAAQALVDLVAAAGLEGSGRRPLASVLVVVDHDTMTHGSHQESVRQTEGGHDISSESIARLCCDAVIRRVTRDEAGVPIDVGRKYRTATDAQWAAIKTMHTGCAWDGCSAPMQWCQAHHIHEWEQGGNTDLDNLVPLCSRHHHQVHEGQWSLKLLPDRSLKIFKPDGKHHSTVATPTRSPVMKC